MDRGILRRTDAGCFTMSYQSLSKACMAAVAMLATWACADAAQLPSSSIPPADSRPTPINDLAWIPCNITTAKGTLVNMAECAHVEVPARREAPESRKVTLAIKRYRKTAQPRGQLWLIAGGPGSAASDFEIDSEFYLGIGRDLELYFLDHRGTGGSSRLACPAEENPNGPSGEVIRDAEWPSCSATVVAKWGEDLAGFSTTEAAADLGELIARTRHGSEPVFVYSVSYGTYLAQRYLQLYATQPTGVILDSICSPGACDLLLAFDRQFDATAQAIFGYCATDPGCALEMGSDPWSHVRDLSTALAQGHCSKLGWSNVTLREVLGLMVTTARLRDYMPAVVKRAERCTDKDVAALGQFQQYMAGIDTEASSFSQALSANIVLSELSVRPTPTANELASNVAGLFASTDAGPRLAGAVSSWPTYARDGYFGNFADTDVPLLMLNGTLDAQTPTSVAQPAGDHYRGPNQHFILIPYSPHTTLTQSIIDESDDTCGAALSRQFLDDPTAALDTACLASVLPLNFAGYPAITSLLFGTDSPWIDAP
jgi:pimeloyl-ACP methyl ester carboxylesterase